MRKNLVLLFLTLSFSFVACQSGPTKIFESTETKQKNGEQISTDTIILDARPAFEYALAHLPGSLNMRWEDFAQKTEPFKGLLEKDLYFHARRLARYGIHPNSKIIIVGRGYKGQGEEGRLAWTFKVLGIKDVTTRTIDTFSLPLTKQEAPPRESVTSWKPVIDESLFVEKKIFLKDIMRPHGSKDYPVVIDVRTEAEYLGKDTTSYYSQNAPDFNAVNIPFKHFFTSQGEVIESIQQRLQEIHITKDKKIYVIDELGVRSAAVTLALREMGYARVINVAGGYALMMAQ